MRIRPAAIGGPISEMGRPATSADTLAYTMPADTSSDIPSSANPK